LMAKAGCDSPKPMAKTADATNLAPCFAEELAYERRLGDCLRSETTNNITLRVTSLNQEVK
jgi:hypothetical protein